MKEKEQETIIITVAAAIIAITLLYGIYIGTRPIPPPSTFYLAANLFPMESYDSYINGTPAAAIFYGTPQANGTECISSVAVYLSNYTSQRICPTPLFIYNPEEVANIYYNSGIVDKVFIPNGYTLLCPNIVNATK